MARPPAGSRVLGRVVASTWYEPAPHVGHKLVQACLAPASWAYGAASSLRCRAYDRGWLPVAEAPIPVVSVGNMVVGGAGKTPVVFELTELLRALGHRVAIVSRGYGATTRRPRIVSDGERLLVPPSEAGDEPYLLATRCSGVAVLAGPDKVALVHRAATELGATVAVLDDGLQHRRLGRDLDVLVVDASSPMGNGCLFPRGPMREGASCAARANLVWLTRVDETPEQPFESYARLGAVLESASCPVVRSRYETMGIVDLEGGLVGGPSHLRGRRVLGVCGIARPGSFVEVLARAGAHVAAVRTFPDHHPFTRAEAAAIESEAASLGAVVVTTEKDAIRLVGVGLEALAVRVRSKVVEGGESLERLLGELPLRGHRG